MKVCFNHGAKWDLLLQTTTFGNTPNTQEFKDGSISKRIDELLHSTNFAIVRSFSEIIPEPQA